DGREELCYPEDQDVIPETLTRLSHPCSTGDVFPLNDGLGLQAFVLLASGSPLPSYRTWKQQAGAAPWRKCQAERRVWFRDGNFVSDRKRGQVQPLETIPKPLAGLCDFFKERAGVDDLEVLAFPVLPSP